jgi:hypothetical protein
LEKHINHYQIRYNTKHTGSLQWRVFENGVEHLVNHVYILAPVYDECSEEQGVMKYNIACDGFMIIKQNVAYITLDSQ